jgi:ribose transport system ATP-binding protein
MGSEIILQVSGIEKQFPGVKALKGVEFDVRKGELHALCGENGAGKSTLMHLLAGVYKPDAGKILLDGQEVIIENQKHANDLGISIVYQERSLVPGLNVAENIYAARQPVRKFGAIDWKKLYSMTREHLKNLNIDIDPKVMVGSLSPAMQQMVEIAKALSIEPKVLILDEPTATITEKEVVALFDLIRKLKKKGIAIIYISHRLSEIFQISDRVTVLKDGSYMGTEETKNVDQNWIVKKMVGREIYFEHLRREVSDEVVLECRNYSDKKRFSNVSFHLNKGEILSFAGLAGAGRTEVFRAIYGADPKISGETWLHGRKLNIRNCIDAINAGIGYLPEDRKEQGLFLEMAVSQNIASASLKQLSRGIELDEKKVAAVAEEFREKLSIATPGIKQKVIHLSGGNQQKVVLAKWLLVNPKILIVDEPTRGVDVGAKSEIYAILRQLTEAGTSIIVISSDLPEVLSLSDRIHVMWNGCITGEFPGHEATEECIMCAASGTEFRSEVKEDAN